MITMAKTRKMIVTGSIRRSAGTSCGTRSCTRSLIIVIVSRPARLRSACHYAGTRKKRDADPEMTLGEHEHVWLRRTSPFPRKFHRIAPIVRNARHFVRK